MHITKAVEIKPTALMPLFIYMLLFFGICGPRLIKFLDGVGDFMLFLMPFATISIIFHSEDIHYKSCC